MAINKRIIKSNDEAAGGASFNTVTYTGDGSSSNAITGVGFQPDLTWIKSRSINYNHQLHDSVRGAGYALYSDLTGGDSQINTMNSFDSDGFTVNASSFIGTNANGQTFVAWNWKAGGAAVSNTDGSITSQVSANPGAGFSIVSYTGNNSNATIGHGLSDAPDMIIVKRRNASGSWNVYHSALGNNSTLILQSTIAELIGEGTWGTTTPTSSVFTVGTGLNDTNNYIAYCFAEVAGFSKFGSFTGTGTTTGEVVTTDFEPAFVMWKKTSNATSAHWNMVDNKRSPSNGRRNSLYANLSSAEDVTAYDIIDFNANGFQVKAPYSQFNESGATFIYMAFANQF